jgi:hypothetical protein
MEPSAQQYRAGAAALVIVALLTVAMIVVAREDSLDGPLLLPLVMAYFLFNAGFVFAAIKGGLQTKGGRLGAAAVSLNLAAILLSEVSVVWTALSAGAALAAVVAAYLLLNDARASAT